VTLYSALPVRDGERVTGAVLVSQSTYRILADLYELRLKVFVIFLFSVAAAVGLSLLLATTIAGPPAPPGRADPGPPRPPAQPLPGPCTP
jgi:two-component system sensor histidine kinase ChvG